MNLRLIFLTFLISFFNSNLKASASSTSPVVGIKFRQATSDDVLGIVELINTHGAKDNDKIVVLPEKFRAGAIQGAVSKGRFFVAVSTDQELKSSHVIGFKKLFCITDKDELDDVLNNELRCVDQDPAASGIVLIENNTIHVPKQSNDIQEVLSSKATYIYNGGDFTHPYYRNKQINASLTAYALSVIKAKVVDDIAAHKSSNIVMGYGLTKSNAGQNLLDGRTSSIVKQFVPFVQEVAQSTGSRPPSEIILSRYPAFMPTFDLNAVECKPLADEQSIAGYGYLLACCLSQSTK